MRAEEGLHTVLNGECVEAAQLAREVILPPMIPATQPKRRDIIPRGPLGTLELALLTETSDRAHAAHVVLVHIHLGCQG